MQTLARAPRCAGHADKSLLTELAVDTEKVFLGYRHASADASEVTFNLKDFKAMLVGLPASCSSSLFLYLC